MRIISSAVVATLLGAGLLLSGCPCSETTVTLTQLSGRFGYCFEGPYGLQGTITKTNLNDPEWLLEGMFVFPTSGYTVDPPEIAIAESFPEQVSIRLRIFAPPPGSAVLQVVTEVPFSTAINASNQATFNMVVSSGSV